jgi:SAM-dependent methyltransferase
MSECSADAVRMAFRLFLNREPESDLALQTVMNSCSTYAQLRDKFLSSTEFRNQFYSSDRGLFSAYWTPESVVEVDVPPSTLDLLLDRVREQWRKLGEEDPYWSVLSNDSFRADKMDERRLTEFYKTGEASAGLIELFKEKTGVKLSQRVCFELGCGVGRVTAHLATRFDHVIAADISPGNLGLCERYMGELGIRNVRAILIESPNDLRDIGTFDFFYSIIVLQHNPPPVQKMLLNNALALLSEGGGCLFQTPARLPNYTFLSDKYLREEMRLMDMHCLPKAEVLKLIDGNGLKIRDIEMDPWIGTVGSYTYFATK